MVPQTATQLQPGRIVVELEEIRRRGVRRLDGNDMLPRLDTFPLIAEIATTIAAAEGGDGATRCHAVERLLETAIARTEGEAVRERLRKLYGFGRGLEESLPVDLMDALKKHERTRQRNHQHQRTFQRHNREARYRLAEAICLIASSGIDQAPAAEPDPAPSAGEEPAAARPGLAAKALAMALLFGTGMSAAFGIGLANDHGLLAGALVVVAGCAFGWGSRAVVFYPVGALLSIALLVCMATGWPRTGVDGMLCGFLVGAVLGQVARANKALLGQLDRGGTRTSRLTALLTSMFWLGAGVAASRQAGNGDLASSIVWAVVTASLIGCGLVARRVQVSSAPAG